MTSTEITLDPMLIAAIIGILIPMVTGIITKLDARDHVKAVTALGLSVLVGVLTCVTKGTVTPDMLVKAGMAAFGANVTTYMGAWKPMGKTDDVLGENLFPKFGIGKATTGGGGDL